LENNSITTAAPEAPVEFSLNLRRNVSETMSQYLSGFLILLMVVSAPLIPALIAVVHWTVGGFRAVANRRNMVPVPSVS
jgi:hypothetical protein